MTDQAYATVARRTSMAGFAFLCHLALCCLTVSGFYGFEKLLHLLYGTDEPMLFDHVPLKFLFQFIDVCIVLVFGYCGIIEAYDHLRGGV
jgi:hypothetical protein